MILATRAGERQWPPRSCLLRIDLSRKRREKKLRRTYPGSEHVIQSVTGYQTSGRHELMDRLRGEVSYGNTVILFVLSSADIPPTWSIICKCQSEFIATDCDQSEMGVLFVGWVVFGTVIKNFINVLLITKSCRPFILRMPLWSWWNICQDSVWGPSSPCRGLRLNLEMLDYSSSSSSSPTGIIPFLRLLKSSLLCVE